MDDLPLEVRVIIFGLAGGDLCLALRWRLVSRSWRNTARHFLVSARVPSLRRFRGRMRLKQLHLAFPSLTHLHVGGTRAFGALPPFIRLCALALECPRIDAAFDFAAHPSCATLTAVSAPASLSLLHALTSLVSLESLHLLACRRSRAQTWRSSSFQWPSLPSLTSLRASRSLVIHMTPLTALSKLRTISLGYAIYGNECPLFPCLESLDLWHLAPHTLSVHNEWKPFASLTMLTSLRLIRNTGGESFLAPLVPFTRLRRLQLRLFTGDVTALAAMTQLTGAPLLRCDRLYAISPPMAELVLTCGAYTDCEFLRPLTKLRTLGLQSAYRLHARGLAALSSLPCVLSCDTHTHTHTHAWLRLLTELDMHDALLHYAHFDEAVVDRLLAVPRLTKVRLTLPDEGTERAVEERLRAARHWEFIRFQ